LARVFFIADPHGKLTLDHFKADTGLQLSNPFPSNISFPTASGTSRKLCGPEAPAGASIKKNGNGFNLTLGNGDLVKSRRVIVATGIAPFPWRPAEFDNLPQERVSHSSDHSDLSRFTGQQILVVGGGQSALDAARILAEYNAKVEIVAKQKQIHWVGLDRWLHRLGFISSLLYSSDDVGPAGISRLVGFPNIFRQLPRTFQDRISARATRPAGTGWQRPYLAKLPITLDSRVSLAEMMGNQVHLKLTNGTDRLVDHVILATGYRVDTARYRFSSANRLKKPRKPCAATPSSVAASNLPFPGFIS
jgi:hypothetical protein